MYVCKIVENKILFKMFFVGVLGFYGVVKWY